MSDTTQKRFNNGHLCLTFDKVGYLNEMYERERRCRDFFEKNKYLYKALDNPLLKGIDNNNKESDYLVSIPSNLDGRKIYLEPQKEENNRTISNFKSLSQTESVKQLLIKREKIKHELRQSSITLSKNILGRELVLSEEKNKLDITTTQHILDEYYRRHRIKCYTKNM